MRETDNTIFALDFALLLDVDVSAGDQHGSGSERR